MRGPLFRKLLAALSVSLVMILLLMFLLMTLTMRRERETALGVEARGQLRELKQMIDQRSLFSLYWFATPYDESALNQRIQDIKQQYAAQIWLVDTEGRTQVLGEAAPEALPGSVSDAQVSALLRRVFAGEDASAQGLFPELGDRVLTLGTPYHEIAGNVSGALLLHVSLSQIQLDYGQLLRQLALVALAMLLLDASIVVWVSRTQYTPLRELRGAVNDFAAGDLSRRLSVTGDDEVAELKAAFNSMAEDLSRLEQVRRDFVASVSHELRSPLTSIQGYIQGMMDGTIAVSEQQRYFEVVLSETRRLAGLVSDLLDLTRIESGKFPLTLTRFDLNELTRRVLIGFEGRIDEKRMDVEVVFRQEHCFVSADHDRIAQVLYNLIDNAVKFSRDGNGNDGGKLMIWTHATEQLCYFTIRDSGEGIAPEDLPLIFERFYKGDKAHTFGMGTGLGLSIVKKILEQHGQKINVTSAPGRGTTMAFTLPAAPQEEGSSKPL